SSCLSSVSIFFYPDTATTEIYTLSLHDALPIYVDHHTVGSFEFPVDLAAARALYAARLFQRGRRALEVVHVEADVVEALDRGRRSEEHTSELQSRFDLVCRLLLEKKNTNIQQRL